MATTKLTLSMPADLVEFAKHHAKKYGKSLSELLREYLLRLSVSERTPPKKIGSRRLRSVVGIVKSKRTDDREILFEALKKKYRI